MPAATIPSPAPRRWPGILLVAAIVLAAFALIGVHGVRQEAANARVLPGLTPLFETLRDAGDQSHRWMQANLGTAGAIGSAALALIAVAALAGAGRRSAPVLLLLAVLALAGWAQVLLQNDQAQAGALCYLAAFVGAIGLGAWQPLRRLPGWPAFPPEAGDARAGLPWALELALVATLILAGLVARTWALTELYDFFDLETINWMIQGRTWHGYTGYLDFGFVQNNGGAVQLLPTQLVFRLFGTSIFTLRLTSVLVSIAAIPLMYWLGRRIGGITAGTIAALLLVTAPEQLFWARNENLHFAPIAICALVTAHVCLWLAQRLSPAAVVATALWMPWCRWFYSASVVAFLIPVAVAGHAMLTGRGLWKKAWYVLPGLAVGLLFWVFSLTVMRAALHDWQWQFVDPSTFYGASAWRKQGEFRDTGTAELVRKQAVSLATNFATVLENMAWRTANFSHWCQRSQPAPHKTILNVGVTMLLFVGLGYLIGQWTDRRAFLLVAWWGIAILPAILSQDPADRRMAMVFPATHAVVGVALTAFLRLVGACGGRLADALAGATAAAGVAVLAVTNLSSHLLLSTQPVMFSDYPRIFKPMLDRGEAILTNVQEPFRNLAVLGNLDRFLEAPNCIQEVGAAGWLDAALAPQCRYTDVIYALTLPAERVEALRQAAPPQRFTYLLRDEPASQPHVALLRALHPEAPLAHHEIARAERRLVAISVAADAVARLRQPRVDGLAADAPLPALLEGVTLQRGAAAAAAPGEVQVSGGVRLDRDGWYRWRLDPPCPSARLAIDGVPADETARPLLAGVHAFALTLPDPAACTLPLRLVRQNSVGDTAAQPIAPTQFVAAGVAGDAALHAPPADLWAGFVPAQPFVTIQGARPLDLGVDAQGNVSVLLQDQAGGHVRRYDPAGRPLASWTVPTPLNYNLNTVAVAPDGTTAVPVQTTVTLYDPQGQAIGGFEHPWLVWESQLAFWGNDLIVANIPHRNSLVAWSRRGEVVAEVTTPAGAPGPLYSPMAIGIGAQGDVLVPQLDGTTLRLRLDGPDFAPRFVGAFRTGSSEPGGGFDGAARILVPGESGLRVFDGGGRRLLAAEPSRDPSQQPFGKHLRIERAGDRLYLLDSDRNAIWMLQG